MTAISDATSSTYVLTSADAGYYVQVVATGFGDYSGFVSATTSEKVVEASSLVVTTNVDVVDSEDGLLSLREAIQAAEAGEMITFDASLKGQTIALSGTELAIAKGITIDASALWNAENNVPGLTLNADEKSRVFYISGGTADAPVKLVGLTITGGNAKGGGVYASKGATTLTNCVVSGNRSTGNGGGIYVSSYSTATFANTTISNNRAETTGGWVLEGGGVFVDYCSTATFIDTTINDNSITSSGGFAQGGGVYVGNDSTATFLNTTINGNSATSSSSFAQGGGVCVDDYSTATFTNTTVTGNSAISTDSTASVYGGGIYVSSNSTATFTNTSITGNKATASGEWAIDAYGGGVCVSNSTATFTNTLITGNKATASGEWAINAYGGGVYVSSNSTATFTNATISGNTSNASGDSAVYSYGGGVYGGGSGSTLTFYNSIIILNTGKSGGNIYAEGTLKGYHSLTSSAAWPNASESGVVNYAYSSSKPLFTNAAKGDYTLAANSQALNKGNDAYAVYADGNPVPFDLLGNRRLDGTVDLGAYERSINAANPPIAASDLKATVGTDRVATLTWRDNATDETGYVVERLVDGVWCAVATLPANSTTWQNDEVLESAAWREFRVAPTNANGRAPWTSVGMVAKSLVVTTNLDVVDDKDGMISLREAIAYSESEASLGGVVTFAPELKGTTITLSGAQLEIKQGIKIDANALWNEENDVPGITVDANELSRVFYVDEKVGTAENSVEFIGLTITGGKITGDSSVSEVGGGGVYVDRESSVKFTNVTIADNVVAAIGTDSAGGGVYVGYKSSATFINSTITGNGALSTVESEDERVWRLWSQGGGVYCYSSSSAIFDNAIISGNSVAAPISESSAMGGGVHSLGNVAFTNSAISGNSATGGRNAWGGGFACNSGNDVNATFTNTTITGNSATLTSALASGFAVGGVFTYATAEFYNSIVVQNVADGDACAADLALAPPGSTPGTANAYNTLSSFTAWGNASANGVANYVYDASQPLFADAANGDYALAEGSQALNKGNDAYAVDAEGNALQTDLAGNVRFNGSSVDLGAYEWIGDLPDVKPGVPAVLAPELEGWSDAIVLATEPGAIVDSAVLTDADTIYYSLMCENVGAVVAGPFNLSIVLKDAAGTTLSVMEPYTDFEFEPGMAVYLLGTDDGVNFGRLAAGIYTATFTVDAKNQIVEANENNNVYTKTFEVVAATSNSNSSSATQDVVSEAFADFFAEEDAEDDFWFEFEKALGKRVK